MELLNRLLAPLTDAFIGVAEPHGRYLAEGEGCPAAKVRVIPNGVDVEKFHPRWPVASLQGEFCLAPGTPVVGIVAALRPETRRSARSPASWDARSMCVSAFRRRPATNQQRPNRSLP